MVSNPFNSSLFFLTFSIVLFSYVNSSEITVEVTPGAWLKGIHDDHNGVSKFLGIRYAQPPTGSRRFQPPVLEGTWTGVKDALTVGHICYQPNPTGASEDCLFLNVYTPNINGSAPVMVWIHGGFFSEGTGNEFDGTSLALNDVVLVTINYRLGILGFLSTGDSAMPGNYGTLDQVEALKWVHNNIRAFGGDPTSVTIFGVSAGSGSVSLQTVSPLAKGLFHRAIMESGASYSYSVVDSPHSSFPADVVLKMITTHVGCVIGNSSAIAACLRNVHVNELMQADAAARKSTGRHALYVPRVDGNFLPDFPSKLRVVGRFNKVDTIHGFTSGEYAPYVMKDPQGDGITKTEAIKTIYGFGKVYSLNNAQCQMIVNNYLDGVTNKIALRDKVVDVLKDLLFALPEVLEIQDTLHHSGTSNSHYFYRFDYRSSDVKTPAWMGIPHDGDTNYVFNQHLREPEDVKMAQVVQKMWTNFAKTGSPNPTSVTWKPFSLSTPAMLEIDEPLVMSAFPRPEKVPMYGKILDYFVNLDVQSTRDDSEL